MAVPVRAPFLIHVLCLLLPLAFSSAKPGCQTHCGNLAVPFPFGIGPNCSIDPSFNISCNTSTNPPKAYLRTLNDFGTSYNLEVTQIFGSQVRVNYPNLVVACYNSSDHEGSTDLVASYHHVISLSGTPFTLSDDNWLAAIGCDDLVTTFLGTRNASSAGYVSYCEDGKDGGKGSCPDNGNGYSAGNGCCRMPIPRGTSFLGVVLADIHYTWRDTKLFPCSFAFVREKMMNRSQSWFSYRLDDLQNPTTFLHNNPEAISTSLVLDWKIGTENCSQAHGNSNAFACKQNSICVDFDAQLGGYTCKCREGYDGNPYLMGAEGCQDIDECASPITNPCELICKNTPGGFNCSCPEGYYGDGRKHGIGCIRLLHSKSKMINVSIGLASGMGFLLLLAIYVWSHKVFQKRKNKQLMRDEYFKRNGGLLLQQQTNDGTLGKTKLFPAKELEKATNHFNETRILGQGGQGTVYKGMLSDGKIAAIKKSKLIDEDQLQQFINEVAILSQINHRNVVKLLGCCLETEEQGRKEEVIAVARLAQRCLNLKGRKRPTMKEVSTELESIRTSQMPSTAEAESQEARSHKAKTILLSDSEYTWTTSPTNATTSYANTHPLMLETV